MHATYEFELVRGEDRSIPVTLCYRDPETGAKELVKLTDYEFLMVIEDARTKEELARLSTDDGGIVLGRMIDREFVQSLEGEEATTLLINITHDMTEKFHCPKATFDLFLISGDIRQCLMVGTIKVLPGCSYD